MAKQVYKINGECPESCFKCCSMYLPLNDYEINKLKKFVRRTGFKPIIRHNLFDKTFNDVCPFVMEDGKCAVYVNRPEVCSRFECDGTEKEFKHNDKRVVNLYKEIFQDIPLPKNAPDAEFMDEIYQDKKKQVFGK